MVGRGSRTNIQLLMLSANLLNPKFSFWWGRGGSRTNTQLLMLSPNLLNQKIPHTVSQGVRTNIKLLDTESKSPKIQNSLYGGEWGGGGVWHHPSLSPNQNFLFPVWGGGVTYVVTSGENLGWTQDFFPLS